MLRGVHMNNLSLGINMTFVGMSVVFLALILLSFCISLFSKIFPTNTKKNDKARDNKDEASMLEIDEDEDSDVSGVNPADDEIAAVLAAAVLASMRSRPESKIRVKSFRRIPKTAPAWNAIGRMEQIASKL